MAMDHHLHLLHEYLRAHMDHCVPPCVGRPIGEWAVSELAALRARAERAETERDEAVAALAAEREACAKIAESTSIGAFGLKFFKYADGPAVAAAIRARSKGEG